MRTFAYLFGAIFICAACGHSARQEQLQTDSLSDSTTLTEIDYAGSYSYEQSGDTVALHLTMQGSKAVGHLTYAWKEKDHNSGSFEGEVKYGVLLANYTFSSEGLTSVREVAFKLDGKTATEGYGDVEERDGKFVFKDSNALDFSQGLVLQKQ
ncbi:hypothetical protein [Sphingobacterium griseoflavum]|nr:hypothetical protein [Sphingobacterium griseoflavum]